jgi:hypothetical protein
VIMPLNMGTKPSIDPKNVETAEVSNKDRLSVKALSMISLTRTSYRNQVFPTLWCFSGRLKCLQLRALWIQKGLKTWFLATYLGLSKVQYITGRTYYQVWYSSRY